MNQYAVEFRDSAGKWTMWNSFGNRIQAQMLELELLRYKLVTRIVEYAA